MPRKQKEFKNLPVSTLIGSPMSNFFRVLGMGKVAPRYIPKLILTFIILLISTPFQIFEYFFYRTKVKKYRFSKPPVFIVGHWRSGTTHLHNLICKDPNHGYITTYQGVFPNNMKSKWIFKTFMAINIPDKRPSDNVKLSPDFPQEEEFAIANMTVASFYHFFYFPELNDFLYEKYVRFKNADDNEMQSFKSIYNELLVKAAFNCNKEQLIIKNPLNTGKIKVLLDLYPDAKFIHIYRNPVVTFLSTYKFFLALLPSTCLQDYEDDYIKDVVIRNYKLLMHDYIETSKLIPKKNLYEIKFEEFDNDNLGYLKEIYNQLGLDSWDKAEPFLSDYVQAQKHYKKNTYKIAKGDLDRVLSEWGFAMEKWGYEIPDNLEVI